MKRTKYQKTGTIAYKLLPTDALTKDQKEIIDTKVRSIKTGEDAEKIAGVDSFGYLKSFHPGVVGILTWRGVEVALFYKRQVISVESEECDPVPAIKIEDPREAWVRLEFLHTRASSLRQSWYADIEEVYNDRIQHLEAIERQQTIEADLFNKKIMELEKELENVKATAERYRQRLISSGKQRVT